MDIETAGLPACLFRRNNIDRACQCGCKLDRDENAALNILRKGLATVGHTGSSVLDTGNAWGETTSTLVGVILPVQVVSLNQESP